MNVLRGTCLPDFHMHTAFSYDGHAAPEEMIERAIALGMPAVCITDHHDMDYPDGAFRLDVPAYREKIGQIRDLYANRIEVYFGVEMGLQPYLSGDERFTGFLEEGGFDYVIGSVHLVDGADPYLRDTFDMGDAELYRRYFEQTLACVEQLDGFHTLGHLDYIVRYGYEREKEYSYPAYREWIDAVLETLIRKDIALEVNTAGYRKGLGFPNPHPDILWRYHEMGGRKVTLGSDAHAPQDIGADFKTAEELLAALGYREICLPHGSELSWIPLDAV